MPHPIGVGQGDSIEDVANSLVALGVKVADLKQVFAKHPPLLAASVEKDVHKQASYLEATFGPTAVAQVILRYPAVLCEPSTMLRLQQRVQCLQFVGIKGRKLSRRFIARWPNLMDLEVQDILEVHRSLQELGLDGAASTNLIASHPRVLWEGVRAPYQQLVTACADVGLDMSIVKKLVCKTPRLLLAQPASVKAILQLLQSHGLSAMDLAKLLIGCPDILTYRLEVVNVKLRFLLDFVGCGLAKAVEDPCYFRAQIATRIGPRSAFIRARSPAASSPSLTTLHCRSDKDFCGLVGVHLDEYLFFKAKWQKAFGAQFGLQPRCALEERTIAKRMVLETMDDLV
ncbi:hypothetical protein WJX72_011451 [[Myrmecia] bisecta]|uniref:Uncharacterized protein n=1 Tax=[Myrmecia] bisecta TaxID=41462 RepID=A0AAW1RAQ2_9CHLO